MTITENKFTVEKNPVAIFYALVYSKGMAVSFDTLEVVEELISAGFTEAQARGISFALKTVQEVSLKDFATKADLNAVKSELQGEIRKLSERMTQENAKLSDRITVLEGKITLLHWMVALMFAGVLSLVMKAFFMH